MEVREIYPIVSAQAGLCPVPIVVLKTHEALDEYFRKTHAWRHTVRIPFAQPLPDSMELPVPQGTRACAVFDVWLNGQEAEHISGDVNIPPPPMPFPVPFHWHVKQGWQFVNGRLEMQPHSIPPFRQFPHAWHGFFEAKAALTIKGHEPSLPDWIDPNEIAAGALGKIFSLAGQPWANGDLALYFTDKFNEAIAEKRVEMLHAGRPGSLRMRAPEFGG